MKKIDIVAGRIAYFKLIVPGTAGSAAHMVNPRLRTVPVLISGDSGAVSDINIFQISKMLFVKQADLPQYFRPIDGGAGAYGKNFAGPAVFLRRFALSPGVSPARAL